MASALDDDARQALGTGRETAGAMLRAAQKDLQKVFIFFLIGFLGTFYTLRLAVWEFLKSVTVAQMSAQIKGAVSIIAQTPFDVILLQAKIGLVVGLIIAAPVFIYYSRDALEQRGLWPSAPVAWWKLVIIAMIGGGLFTVGVAYGYFLFFPFTFSFLAKNAVAAGFAPTYSIVKWAQFIFLLTISFGFASQLPLAMPGLSYVDIVPYETFRDKWRYAVLGVFAAGALFTPPDPFTQILWAVPVLVLYGVSLYLTKIVTIARRGSKQIDITASINAHWNIIAGFTILGGGLAYAFFVSGGASIANMALGMLESQYRVVIPESSVLLSVYVFITGVITGVIGVGYAVYNNIDDLAAVEAGVGDPASVDLDTLDEAGIQAAPPEVFAAMSEPEAMAAASDAIDAGNRTKAQAIIDRFDQDGEDAEDTTPDSANSSQQSQGTIGAIRDRTSRAGKTFLSEFDESETETEADTDTDTDETTKTTEEEFTGYYKDVTFILNSVTSNAFRLVAVFMATLAVTFGWLYTGGIRRVYDDFLRRLPAQVRPEEVLNVVALHPMEALIFEVKLSTIIAAVATLPLAAYYAWPALREREIIAQRRRMVFVWTGAIGGGIIGGFILGYTIIAPAVISWLVNSAVVSDMIVAYRITNFFWLIFFTTAGIGLLADVPIAMILLNNAGISYNSMRGRWREVTVAMLAIAAIFTPADILTMFLITVPLMAAYAVGLVVLFIITVGGRRDRATDRDRGVEPNT
ncbi:twin-arginine translocase subunit TatC [Haloquadratum walsbyi]|jgi:Twin arginine targeting (Tat) protein translocase TatC, Archaeal clade|uniref:Sec-independent protein translocase protein TatC n=1 Tax=Haloquadratum walsbyi J07HQW2 TaxID=1238425 RepID=U1NFL5_9EURY|nr:twin-arginine translocase subunit TatC [Haloquadratum walsbyi]ERG95860.1 MAG: Sec-independent protein secretion pathway component TatC [Haloquadratum walsbyi J07HQW2]